MQYLKSSRLHRRSSARLGSVLLLGGSLLAAACDTNQFCAEGECSDDGGGESPSGGKKGTGGRDGIGGNPGTGGKDGAPTGGFGGETEGAGGALGGMAGSEPGATGGKANPDGSGGMFVDPGELDGRIETELLDILPGRSAEVTVSLERSGGFQGAVLVSLDGEPFTGTQVFAGPSETEVTLTIQADSETEQGYYDASVIAESSDGILSVEIPLNIRVRGAPGTLDLTFGDREMPWVGDGTQAGAAVDDAGFVYLRNESTVFRFDKRGVLDESFAPEGLGEELGPMMGMEDGVLVGSQSDPNSGKIIHVRGTGEQNPAWTGSHQLAPEWPIGLTESWSLNRRDDFVVVGGEYDYPASYIQLFQTSGAPITSFLDTLFYGESGPVRPVQARLDSQGRVLATRQDDGAIRRLLPDGSLDTSFADDGELVLSGTNPVVVDFEVLSEDGLAILVDADNGHRLAIWTPSGSGSGAIAYHDLPEESFSGLLRLDSDRLITVGRDPDDRWPPTFIRLFTASGEPVTSFGESGALNLNQTSVPHYAPLPDFDRLGWEEPAYDPKANRLIAHGTDLGKVYLYSIWL